MKAKIVTLLAALVFSVSLAAQTTIPKPDPKNYARWEDYNEALIDWKIQKVKLSKPAGPQCTTIAKCKLALKTEIDAKDISQAELASRLEDNAKLEQENKELKARLADTTKKFDEFKALAQQLYDFAVKEDADFNKLIAAHVALTDKYNSLLEQSTAILQQANARLAKQQRFNNALAMYNALPKYQPPQTSIHLNVDCSKTPALCIR